MHGDALNRVFMDKEAIVGFVVGTRGWGEDGRGPCACPVGVMMASGLRGSPQAGSPTGRGQAQGPRIHPSPHLVPTVVGRGMI